MKRYVHELALDMARSNPEIKPEIMTAYRYYEMGQAGELDTVKTIIKLVDENHEFMNWLANTYGDKAV